MSIRYDVGDVTLYIRHTLAKIAPNVADMLFTDTQKFGGSEEWEIKVRCSPNSIKEDSYNADVIVSNFPCQYDERQYKIKFSIYIHKCFLEKRVNNSASVESIYLHGFDPPQGLTYPQLAEIEQDIRARITSSLILQSV